MGYDLEEDKKRKPIELNILAARKRQKKQTGFVHYCYESTSVNEQDTIPILENICFALALFRSRLTENILEGKIVLERILAFEVQGNFPVYLHEYPVCRDHALSLHALPALHWIGQDFRTILGEELKLKLENTITRITEHGRACYDRHLLSKSAAAKLWAYAKDLKFLDWEPASPSDWGHFLICLQLAAPLEHHFHRAIKHWHPAILVYAGPNKRQFQEKNQPALTLYDLYMGHFFQSYSKRALQDHPIHLQAALIRSVSCPIPPSAHDPNVGLHIEEKNEIPFTLLWGSAEHTHSLVCSLKKAAVATVVSDQEIEMDFALSEVLPEEGGDQMEICFYCNIHNDNSIFVNDQQATVFQLEDKITIHSSKMRIELSFHQAQGEGTFFGHLSRANRPMQKSCVGENLHEAYDWQISLRTIRRQLGCSIKCQIRVIRLSS
jgi:hypothetical protein